MMKKNFIIFTVIAASLFAAGNIFAGIGDGSGPFDEGNKTEDNNSTFGSTTITSNFGSSEMESVADIGEPPLTPREVPLDGGASLLLLGGIGVGISRSLKKLKRHVVPRQ